MSIRNLKDNSKKPWICECYPMGRSGKRVRKKFATKGEAAAFELFTMKGINDKPWLGDKPDSRRLLHLIELWYQLHGKNTRSGKRAMRRMEIVCEELNNPIANHINERMFAHYRANRTYKGSSTLRKDNHEAIALSTHNHDLIWLKTMFNELIRLKEWKLPNPLADIRKFKISETEIVYLKLEEIEHLLHYVLKSEKGEELRLVFMVCLATGARIREVLNLKGSQVSKCRITFVETKGKKNRTIPISETLYNDIRKEDQGKVFSCSYSLTHKWFSLALPNLPKGQGTHTLRHTFASHFMMNGGNIIVLKNILGHTEISMTMRYAHFAPNHLEDAVIYNPLNQIRL